MESVGWLGGIMLALCGLPQAVMSLKNGHSRGVSMVFIQLWFWGEIFTLTYVLVEHGTVLPLITNYLFNIAIISIIWRYQVWPRK